MTIQTETRRRCSPALALQLPSTRLAGQVVELGSIVAYALAQFQASEL